MNIKRGLFRLWVLLSVLGCLVTAALTWNTVAREFALGNAQERRIAAGGLNIPIRCGDSRGVHTVDYTLDTNDVNGADAKCWYQLTTFRRLFPEYNDMSDAALLEKTYTHVGISGWRQVSPWWLIAQIAGTTVGVCLGLLLLGSAIYWALAGFARTPKTDL